MELTVHITYFPMEAQYGASLWEGDKMVDIDYQLYDTKQEARRMGGRMREDYIAGRTRWNNVYRNNMV